MRRLAEAKVALVPRAVVATGWSEREYGLLLTGSRALFVLERTIPMGLIRIVFLLGMVLGGVVAVILTTSFGITIFLMFFPSGLAITVIRAASRTTIPDYEGLEPEELEGRPGLLSVPYASLSRLDIDRPRRRIIYLIHLEYRDAAGGPQTLTAQLRPKVGWMRDRRREKIPVKAIYETYAQSVRDAVQQALPPDILSKVAGGA